MKKQYSPGAARSRKIWLVLPVAALIGALIGAGIAFFPDKFSLLANFAVFILTQKSFGIKMIRKITVDNDNVFL